MSKEDWKTDVATKVVQRIVDHFQLWPQSDVKSVLGLMEEYGADLNGDQNFPTMVKVAMDCNAKLFQTLRGLGANASAAAVNGWNATIGAQIGCEEKFCTNDTCPEEYIGQPVSQAIANLAQQ